MKKITNEELKVFSQFIYEISGIVLDESKGYLIETRLRPLMSEVKSETFSQLFAKIKSDSSGKLKHKIVDAISTNETFFFRDNKPFELLRNKIVPDLIDRRKQQHKSPPTPLRIWSAACSSGQELYSIAITLKEMLPNINAFNIHILGSDISDKIIAQASYGKYSRFEVDRGLPKQYLHRYFNQVGNEWRIKDEIRAMAQFSKTNLLKPFPEIGKFDIIFCRNVAIYFSAADRQRLFNNIANVLEPDGALLLGGSESMSGINSSFESKNYLRTIYFQKKPSHPSVSVAPKIVSKRKPLSEATKPTNIKKKLPRKKLAFSPPQVLTKSDSLSRKALKARSQEKKPPIQEQSSPPSVAKVKEAVSKSRPYKIPPQPQIKKSLLSSLQEKKKEVKSRLFTRQTGGTELKSKEVKSSLLDEIAKRHKDKKKC